jgi:hypothetical protein
MITHRIPNSKDLLVLEAEDDEFVVRYLEHTVDYSMVELGEEPRDAYYSTNSQYFWDYNRALEVFRKRREHQPFAAYIGEDGKRDESRRLK